MGCGEGPRAPDPTTRSFTAVSTLAVYAPDLMDRSRIASAHPEAEFVSAPTGLIGTDAEVCYVDLNRPGVLEVVPDLEARVVGFVRHDDQATIEAATRAGCDEVVVRSVFFRRLNLS